MLPVATPASVFIGPTQPLPSSPCFLSHHATLAVANSFHLLLLFLNMELTSSSAVMSWGKQVLRLLARVPSVHVLAQCPGISLVLSTHVDGKAALVLETHLKPVTREN